MKLKQHLQKNLEEWAKISGLSFCLLDESNEPFVSVGSCRIPSDERLRTFREGKELCVSNTSTSLYKITDSSEIVWILLVQGTREDSPTIGELAVCQVKSLLETCQEKNDKNTFVQNLLLGKYTETEAFNLSRKYHITPEVSRSVFLIETKHSQSSDILTLIRNIFSSRTRDLITAIDDSGIILLHEAQTKETAQDLQDLAHMLVDMLNTEAMTFARISYSNPSETLTDLPNAYREAKTAMEIGKIFYAQQHVFAYDRLGIGRLIYQLPLEICELFLKESFQNDLPENLDEETLNTIRTFFENNLNLSETSRQLYIHRNTLVYRFEKLQKKLGLDLRTFEDAITFKIALMVSDYVKYRCTNT